MSNRFLLMLFLLAGAGFFWLRTAARNDLRTTSEASAAVPETAVPEVAALPPRKPIRGFGRVRVPSGSATETPQRVAVVPTAAEPVAETVGGTGAVQNAGVERITVLDMAGRIASTSNKPSVVVLYKTNCPISKRMFPQLTTLAKEYGSRGVDFHVYSVDDDEYLPDIRPYLAAHQAPFAPIQIQTWVAGQLTQAMSRFGIHVTSPWTTPLVAVLDKNGQVLVQGDGVGNLDGLADLLRSGELQR
jgi:thiol-disulfide isomerase/thioredoxin